jgi:Pilus formation protein N terminal region
MHKVLSIACLLAFTLPVVEARAQDDAAGVTAQAGAVASPQGKTAAELAQNIDILPGRAIVISTQDPFDRILVGDPKIADALPLSDHAFSLTSKEQGLTNFILLNDARAVVAEYVVHVHYPTHFVTIFHGESPSVVYECSDRAPEACVYPAAPEPPGITISTGPVITGEAVRAAKTH